MQTVMFCVLYAQSFLSAPMNHNTLLWCLHSCSFHGGVHYEPRRWGRGKGRRGGEEERQQVEGGGRNMDVRKLRGEKVDERKGKEWRLQRETGGGDDERRG